ncbi:MAG: hypothetical protein ABI702_07470 [Burkholderiales bacterium]
MEFGQPSFTIGPKPSPDKLCIVRTQGGIRGMVGRCQHCGTRNGPAVQVCRQCGEPLGGEPSLPFTDAVALDRPVPVAVFEQGGARSVRAATGLRLGALVLALGAGAWWAVKPSIAVLLPGVEALVAPMTAAASAARSEPTALLAEPAGDEPVVAIAEAASAPESPVSRSSRSRDRATDLGRAKALREQSAGQQAEADAARLRDGEATARLAEPAPAAPMAVEPIPAPPARPRTAQELCANGHALARGICLARTCIGPEHAEEAACQQLRTADDQRRH